MLFGVIYALDNCKNSFISVQLAPEILIAAKRMNGTYLITCLGTPNGTSDDAHHEERADNYDFHVCSESCAAGKPRKKVSLASNDFTFYDFDLGSMVYF